jgi:hypothetical protein
VAGVSGVIRCFLPFPVQVTWAPVLRNTSARVREVSSETRSPAWMASVSSARSRRPVLVPVSRGGEQCGGFGLGEGGDELAVEPLGRDGRDPLDDGCALKVAQGRVAEQGVDRGEPGVAGADAVAALVLQVVEERAGQRGVEVGDLQAGGLFPGLAGGEGQEQPD